MKHLLIKGKQILACILCNSLILTPTFIYAKPAHDDQPKTKIEISNTEKEEVAFINEHKLPSNSHDIIIHDASNNKKLIMAYEHMTTDIRPRF